MDSASWQELLRWRTGEDSKIATDNQYVPGCRWNRFCQMPQARRKHHRYEGRWKQLCAWSAAGTMFHSPDRKIRVRSETNRTESRQGRHSFRNPKLGSASGPLVQRNRAIRFASWIPVSCVVIVLFFSRSAWPPADGTANVPPQEESEGAHTSALLRRERACPEHSRRGGGRRSSQ